MPLDAPFSLGPFLVSETGELSPGSPDAMPAFSIRWRDHQMRVRICRGTARQEGRGVLDMQLQLGRVPSTAGGEAGFRQTERMRLFTVLRGVPGALPPEWRLHLLPDHRVTLETRAPIRIPISATDLVSEVTLFLLALGPYLDVLDEVGLTLSGAGTMDPCQG